MNLLKMIGLQRATASSDDENKDPQGVSAASVDAEINAENITAYIRATTFNQWLRFSSLYDQNLLAWSLINKVHSLLWRDGWTITQNPNVPMSMAVFTLLQQFWDDHVLFFDKLILEGLITGSLALRVSENEMNANDLFLESVQGNRIVSVKRMGHVPIRIKIGDAPLVNPETFQYYTDKSAELFAVETGPSEDIVLWTGESFTGDVIYQRFNYRLNDDFGQSFLYPAQRELRGFQEVVGNTVSLSRRIQAVAWNYKNFGGFSRDKKKRAAAELELNRILSGRNGVLYTKGGEEIESITPDVRRMDMTEYINGLLQVCLSGYLFSPSLFGHPSDQNRATLEESDRAYEQRYVSIQKEYMQFILFIMDYIHYRITGNAVQNCIEIQLPKVVTATLSQRNNDRAGQLDILDRLLANQVIDIDTYRAQVLIVVNGGEVMLTDDDLMEGELMETDEDEDEDGEEM